MTCKDCVHYEICKDDCESGYIYEDENGNYCDDDCEYRKSKADYKKVKYGKWLKHNTECSVCHEMNPTNSLDEWSLKFKGRPTKYCGNCGARMDERGKQSG